MEVKNCRSCGRLFNYMGGERLCPSCKDELEKKFQQVKTYIYSHKEASVNDVSEENDVSVQQIKQWVREERLSFSDSSLIGLECESCGALVHTGRFCEACKKKLANNLEQLYSNKKPVTTNKKDNRERARMRFLDN